MKILKSVILLLMITFCQGCVVGQPDKAKSQEQKRVKLLKGFCQYLQKTPQSRWDTKKLQHYIYASDSDSAWIAISQQGQLMQAVLKVFQKNLQGENLSEYDAVSWLNYPAKEKLPRMAWEKAPVSDISGQPIPTAEREKEIKSGQDQQENIWIVFKKNQPDVPLHFILFDENSEKIASWVLVNQGGLHYFLRF